MASTFHGVAYPFPDVTNDEPCASDTVMYGTRLMEELTSAFNNGCSTVLHWQAAEWDGADNNWGVLRSEKQGSAPRPIFYALQSFIPKIPLGASLLTAPTQAADFAEAETSVYTTVFYKEGQIVINVINNSPIDQPKRIDILNIYGQTPTITDASAFVKGDPTDPYHARLLRRTLPDVRLINATTGQRRIDCWLPSDSMLTLKILYQPANLIRNWPLDDFSWSSPVVANVHDSAQNGTFYDADGRPGAESAKHSVKAIRGKGLTFDGKDDFIEAPALNQSFTNLAINCWIKRDGSQGIGDKIVAIGSSSGPASIQFYYSNCLSYTWNNYT